MTPFRRRRVRPVSHDPIHRPVHGHHFHPDADPPRWWSPAAVAALLVSAGLLGLGVWGIFHLAAIIVRSHP